MGKKRVGNEYGITKKASRRRYPQKEEVLHLNIAAIAAGEPMTDSAKKPELQVLCEVKGPKEGP